MHASRGDSDGLPVEQAELVVEVFRMLAWPDSSATGCSTPSTPALTFPATTNSMAS